MVGKIKHVRQKLHQEAVKLDRPSSLTQPTLLPQTSEKAPKPALDLNKISRFPPLESRKNDDSKDNKQTQAASSFPTGIFAGTKITPEALVQTLKFEEPPDVVVQIPAKKGPEEKKVKSKKEKMKERRERWLNKISSIKQAREQQVAQARRQAMPVVGDMRPLADALPELSQLIAPAATASAARRKNRKNTAPVKKRPEPTDFSLMKLSQKRKLLETETSRFGEAVKSLAAKTNPLADIGEQLRKRMRQEEEQGPS
ncbi:ribosome biogenesis protein SLX9 homolog [Centroberyx gerrardi]|uniref:ribosome biogenesis protein SLX9 homolog n=1 Tax=Centroberyx gerrardi TaxID=166262 RepID=UPI003AB00626